MRFGRRERDSPRHNELSDEQRVDIAANLVRSMYPLLIDQFIENMEPTPTSRNEETGQYHAYKTHGTLFPDAGRKDVNDTVPFVASRVVLNELITLISVPDEKNTSGQNQLGLPDDFTAVLDRRSPWGPPTTDGEPRLKYDVAIVKKLKDDKDKKDEPKKLIGE